MLTVQQTRLALVCKWYPIVSLCQVMIVYSRESIIVAWSLSNEGMESHTRC